ncbi:hypothetical protein [Litoribrevibacter albus]|uniref:PilZ domain-containing protein n=1 Tax=Litoribrevibacter albus TaxID=1473156 RepID=A0AA37WAE8_9GAMM|nr:hypothetical protein [Litoribrevibacter albus]GLQ33641.1 hypothetical protein GCM10007876_41210 [Litoribrevibacter albus]
MNQPSTKEMNAFQALDVFHSNNEFSASKTSESGRVTQLTERVFPRLRMKAEYQVCIGFDQVFSSLPSMEDGWCSEDTTSSDPQIHQMSESSEGDMLRFSSYEEVMADVALEKSEVASVEVIDVSAGGFCLEIDPRKAGYPKIGEVMGVREHQNAEWKICVIRWSRPSSEGAQIGVELLAPSAFKTLLRDPYTEAVQSPAVFIPGMPLVGVPDSVLLPQNRSVTTGDKALVRRSGVDLPFLMDKSGLITGSVKRLFISAVEANDRQERVDIASSDIWASF